MGRTSILLGVREVDVLEDPRAASLALDPVKGRILAALTTPGSAASMAG